jgi:hypothetical protein
MKCYECSEPVDEGTAFCAAHHGENLRGLVKAAREARDFAGKTRRTLKQSIALGDLLDLALGPYECFLDKRMKA